MVSKKIIYGLLVLGTFLSCSQSTIDSTIPSGSTPFLTTSNPTTLKLGTKVEITGVGFSIVSIENIISLGGTTIPASSYKVNDSGNEVLTFDIPNTLPTGDTTLLVIVDGEPSNSMKVTVTP